MIITTNNIIIGLLMLLTPYNENLSLGSKNNTSDINHSYYINSQSGNDNLSGSSPEEAWKSLQRLEQQTIVPGDIIYLSAEAQFRGSLKLNNLSGSKDNPITITSYNGEKAVIESGTSFALMARNCKFLKIKNIRVTGSGSLNGNETNGMELFNCQFCKIDSVEANKYLYSGIQITGGNDIQITHSKAYDNGFCGINVESGVAEYGDGSAYKIMKNLYIGHCHADNNPGCPAILYNHSGNGILVGGVTNGLIEYCEASNNGWDMPRTGNGPVGIWAYMSDSITIQYCYAHHNKTSPQGGDGGGFDLDGGVRYSVMQYNLSAFNEGAGYGIFQYPGATEWSNNTMRYNISYKDGAKNGKCGISYWCDPAAMPMTNFHAYNNTIVNNFHYGVYFTKGVYKNFLFENNITLVTVPTDKFIGGGFSGATFNNNIYFAQNQNTQPEEDRDKAAIYANPQLIMPENDSLFLKNDLDVQELRYFMINNSSIGISAGKIIENSNTFDLWGNLLLSGIKPNIGAWQGK